MEWKLEYQDNRGTNIALDNKAADLTARRGEDTRRYTMRNYTTHYIKEGDVINGLGGYLEIDHYNGSGLFYANEYEFLDGDGNVEFVGRNAFTAEEIAHYMRDADGRNHKVFYTGRDDEEGEEQ